MPQKQTMERAKRALRSGKRPSTAAGKFVREEIEHVRSGKHGARSPKQANAIGLSTARRAEVPLKAPPKGQVKESTRRKAEKDYEAGRTGRGLARTAKRSPAARGALRRAPASAASRRALSTQAKQSHRPHKGAKKR